MLMNDRLYRSTDDRMLAGVAGGLADYWDADPSLIRVLWVILAFATGGIALVVYIVMAIVVPEEPGTWAPSESYGASSPPAAPSAATNPGAATAASPEVGGGAQAPPPASPGFQTAPDTMSARDARRAARDARRAARRERRSGTGGVIVGVFFVLLGGFFLAREFLPQLRWDWFWPLILIAIGVLILVAAVGRPDDDQSRGR
jgi:phage shock protein C